MAVAPKKAPKASRPTKSRGGGLKPTHTSLGVAKAHSGGGKNDKRTPKQRAAELVRLEKTLPTLNTVVPKGATGKVKGGRGKIGKVFVDDHDKDKFLRMIEQAAGKQEVGEESKLERARKLEAIREARRKEAEKREESKREKLDESKDKARKRRKSKDSTAAAPAKVEKLGKDGKPKKKVGFA
ncbi:hypothetical protein FN846DRAFT_903103 [Sphaerosporella brunnea]|uniref:60S ribosomal subunit assembly/export protein loc1 n=1 Tax=Sphaerosporella brunnea TaxID=1250544 RepID=A0A5J5F7U9_9PEZI|nr:hypothetical protein FN846DRAFT_903103 [Sphaerosporella brunnea]